LSQDVINSLANRILFGGRRQNRRILSKTALDSQVFAPIILVEEVARFVKAS